VTVSGPRADMVTPRRSASSGIWINTELPAISESADLSRAVSNRPSTPSLRRKSSGGNSSVSTMCCSPSAFGPDYADVVPNDAFRSAFVRLRSQHGLYREATSAVTFLTPTLVSHGIPLPAEVRSGPTTSRSRCFPMAYW